MTTHHVVILVLVWCDTLQQQRLKLRRFKSDRNFAAR